MKFLLVGINAKYLHSNPALYSLQAYAGLENKKNIEIVEYTINQHVDMILGNIYERKPDILGFSCYIWNIEIVHQLINEIHKILPNVPIWLGGPEVSYDVNKELNSYPQITGIMVGEGEETFKELLEYYKAPNENSLMDIKGLALSTGLTEKRAITNLSQIPFLYDSLSPFQNRIVYYESSRGCPYNCSYCLSSIDKKVRLRDLEIVKEELQFFLNQKLPQVKFIDRTFNCNRLHAKEILNFINENDNGITNFHFEVAGDILNQEEIEILNHMRKGLVQLEVGVQTTNKITLKEIDRVTDIEKLKINIEKIRSKKNIHLHLDLIVGLPYEDYFSFQKSFNEVYHMKPNELQLGFLKVLKGSKMWMNAKEYGIAYQDKPPYEVLYTKWISYEEILKLKRIEEVLELYYNSNQFIYTLRFLEKKCKTPFELYEKLALFYEEKGYEFISSSRVKKYEILFTFACEYDAKNVDIYRELLTFDLYLRENMKKRPEYCKDQSEYKKIAKEFYEEEIENPNYLKEYKGYDLKQLSRMTHFEFFNYPIFKEDISLDNKKYAVIFDYQKRCPITYESAYYIKVIQ